MMDWTSYTVAELRAIAQKKKIAMPSGVKKSELIALLKKTKSATTRKKSVSAKKTTRKIVQTKQTKKTDKKGATKAGDKKGIKKTAALKTKTAALKTKKTSTKKKVAAATRNEAGYGEERITLMPRDPDTVYAYWEATAARIEQKKMSPDSELCIRIYDMSGSPAGPGGFSAYYDQPVSEEIGSAYFSIERPGHPVRADLGLLSPEGSFRTLASSHLVLMPADRVSEPALTEAGMGREDVELLSDFTGEALSPHIEGLKQRIAALSLSSTELARGKREKRKR